MSLPQEEELNIHIYIEYWAGGSLGNNRLGVTSKKNSIFVDIVHVGGREVNPMSKNLNEIIFDKSWRGRGSNNILSKIEALYFE